ncbi:hypothetical protein ES707_11873 [subsurface metagenome]
MKQGVYEESLAPLYPIGLGYKEPGPMGRSFHYCHAGEALDKVVIGQVNLNGLHEGNSYGAVTAGGKTITVVDAAGTLNQYKDGILTIFTTHLQILRIKSNTGTSSGHVTLTLKDPLLYDVADATFCGWYPNIYGNIGTQWALGTGFNTFVIVNLIPVTSGYHFWGQTYGFCHGVPNTDPFGTAGDERDIYFHIDGSLKLAEECDFTTISPQRAGYLLPKTSAAGGDQAFMLQLAP